MLKINNLSKTYSNGVQALNGIDLEIATGMFGLQGAKWSGEVHLDAHPGDTAGRR